MYFCDLLVSQLKCVALSVYFISRDLIRIWSAYWSGHLLESFYQGKTLKFCFSIFVAGVPSRNLKIFLSWILLGYIYSARTHKRWSRILCFYWGLTQKLEKFQDNSGVFVDRGTTLQVVQNGINERSFWSIHYLLAVKVNIKMNAN